MDKTKYVVLIPYIGGRHAAHLRCMNTLRSIGVHIIEYDGCPYIDMAQAYLVETALEQTKAEVFMFIEHDMVFDPQDVERMIQRLLDSEYDAVGAIYALKTFGIQQYIGKLADPKSMLTFYKPGMYAADFLGFGFTAIRRSVFELLSSTLPFVECSVVNRSVHPFFLNAIEQLKEGEPFRYNGNDVSFFNRMLKAKLKIAADLEINVGHLGNHEYHLEDASHILNRPKAFNVVFNAR
jgi:hypothetical protein